jgi:DNA-binding NtrC family response regulator
MWKCICDRIEGLDGIDTFTGRSDGSIEKREPQTEKWSKPKAIFKIVKPGAEQAYSAPGHLSQYDPVLQGVFVILGIGRKTLYRKIQALNLEP